MIIFRKILIVSGSCGGCGLETVMELFLSVLTKSVGCLMRCPLMIGIFVFGHCPDGMHCVRPVSPCGKPQSGVFFREFAYPGFRQELLILH